MMNTSSDTWQHPDSSKRPLIVLLVAGIAILLALAIVRDRSRSQSVGLDTILQYEVLELRSRQGLHDRGLRVIYYFQALGDLRASNGEDFNYVPSTRLTLDADGPDCQAVRDWVIKHVNLSEQHAHDLIFDDRLVVRYVAMEAIDRESWKKVDNRLADHVYDVLSELASERDPFLAGFALVCLEQAKRWSLPAFQAAINHPVAVVRGQAIDYADGMQRRQAAMAADERLEMMTTMAGALGDPHVGIRQLARYALQKTYLDLCDTLPRGSPTRAAAAALQDEWSFTDELAKSYLEAVRPDVEVWKNRIASLRSNLE